MEQEVRRAQTGDAVDQLNPEKRAILELLLLSAVELIMLRDAIMRGEQDEALEHFKSGRPIRCK